MLIVFVLVLLITADLSLRVYHQRTARARLPAVLRAETRAITWENIRDKYRVVCFGDSITFGEDLPYEQSFPAVLADLLRQRHIDLDVAVINVGIGGHTSVQGLARLQRDVLWYKPHAVIVAFGLNDGNLGYWPLDPVRERQMCGALYLWERTDSLLRHSHLYLTLRGRIRRLLRRFGWLERPIEISTEGEPQPRVSREGLKMAQECLVARIQQNGNTTLFLATMTPVTEAFHADLGPALQQRQRAIYDEYNRVIRDTATRDETHLLDLHEILKNHAQTETPSLRQERNGHAPLLAEDGVHLTPAGEQLVAISVLQALEETGLPGSAPYRRR